MSAGSKIVQLRDVLRVMLRYTKCLPNCPGDVGGVCRCGFHDARRLATHLCGADPARTGGARSLLR